MSEPRIDYRRSPQTPYFGLIRSRSLNDMLTTQKLSATKENADIKL